MEDLSENCTIGINNDEGSSFVMMSNLANYGNIITAATPAADYLREYLDNPMSAPHPERGDIMRSSV